jgi:DNA repair protein RecO (recombination protein O)
MTRGLVDSGFLLRKIPYSESSFILKAFTRAHGLVSFMAKGAKRQNSRLHGLLEPVIHVQYLFPAHSRGEIRMLTDVSLLRDFSVVREDIVKQSLAQVLGEVLLRYTPDETGAPEFHDLLLASMERLEAAPPERAALRAVFARFLLEYCEHAGYRPQFRFCVRCRGEASGASVAFEVDRGGPLCARCEREEPGVQRLREPVIRWLGAVQDGAEAEALGRADAGRAEDFLLLYLGRHAGAQRAQRALKALPVWHALMEG